MRNIVQRFAEHGYQIDPQALELIESYSGPRDELVRQILDDMDNSVAVIRPGHICGFLTLKQSLGTRFQNSEVILENSALAKARDNHNQAGLDKLIGQSSDLCSLSSAVSSRHGIEVNYDITGNSTCMGEYEDFIRYFRDRYAKIKEILAKRLNARPIESLGKSTAGREVSLIGMVLDIRTTAKGHRILELEDPTGMVTAIIQKDSELFELSSYIVTDEVLGLTAISDGNGRIFVKSLLWPDLPNQCQTLIAGSGSVILTSDLHVGSKFFMEDAWSRFVAWINGEVDDPSGLASQVRSLVIAGDVVDGIGVYPGQEGDLAIKDIYEQYELAAQWLNGIRKEVRIVISPGNHDIVRQAEPQPALPPSVQKFFSENMHFVGDPAWVTIDGASLLVYHGRSIDDLVMRIPGLSYGQPEKAMVEMLRRRHLSPIYGGRVSIAPEHQDPYVIHKPPAILQCGHVHTVGIARYKGVAVINSGTWQSQTEFQKKMNIQPTPAAVPIVDMATMKVRKLLFA
jgi:DNA polymerase II small subunit